MSGRRWPPRGRRAPPDGARVPTLATWTTQQPPPRSARRRARRVPRSRVRRSPPTPVVRVRRPRRTVVAVRRRVREGRAASRAQVPARRLHLRRARGLTRSRRPTLSRLTLRSRWPIFPHSTRRHHHCCCRPSCRRSQRPKPTNGPATATATAMATRVVELGRWLHGQRRSRMVTSRLSCSPTLHRPVVVRTVAPHWFPRCACPPTRPRCRRCCLRLSPSSPTARPRVGCRRCSSPASQRGHCARRCASDVAHACVASRAWCVTSTPGVCSRWRWCSICSSTRCVSPRG